MKLTSKNNKKYNMLCFFLGVLILFALYYFSKKTIREGITDDEYDELKKDLDATKEDPIKSAIDAEDKVKEDQEKIDEAKAAMDAAYKNYQESRDDYAKAIKVLEADMKNASSAEEDASEAYQSLISQIYGIGIRDPIYSLIIEDDVMSTPHKINDIKLLVDGEINKTNDNYGIGYS